MKTTVIAAATLSLMTLTACVAAPPANNGGGTTPKPDASVLNLTSNQMSNLRTLLGLNNSSPFTVKVLDQDNSHSLSVGDVAVMNGGITNGEISRRALSAPEIQSINANPEPATPLQQLQAAQTLWKQKQPEHYAITLKRSCFCPPEFNKPIEVRVYRGVIQQATIVPDGKPLPVDRKHDAMTVEDLFKMIQDAIAGKAESVDVKYDPQFGFPTAISIDRSRMIADEEVYISVSDFKVASGLKPAQ